MNFLRLTLELDWLFMTGLPIRPDIAIEWLRVVSGSLSFTETGFCEQASGWASGLLLTAWFKDVLNHCAGLVWHKHSTRQSRATLSGYLWFGMTPTEQGKRVKESTLYRFARKRACFIICTPIGKNRIATYLHLILRAIRGNDCYKVNNLECT